MPAHHRPEGGNLATSAPGFDRRRGFPGFDDDRPYSTLPIHASSRRSTERTCHGRYGDTGSSVAELRRDEHERYEQEENGDMDSHREQILRHVADQSGP